MTSAKYVKAVLSIGSNFGERQENVASGIKWLSEMLTDVSCSHIYATPDCHGGFREYINAVLSGYTILTPLELDTKCKQFELEHGRTLEARKAGNVAIDIDLVIYGNDILRPKDFAREFFKIGYSCI
ncbi:MAG: 2-amino-4-hydroxy-6-hydroxymethyldihydropteridine diphosphokinase [Muribaculaceae bacterium]|nr:2-amino-4-hydroxy-6-hydroxymethyldihydropteridine diphosphokinase [Muribaculaceae bacterium]